MSGLSKNLKLAFKPENLNRAWLWIITNSDRTYKNYLRHIDLA